MKKDEYQTEEKGVPEWMDLISDGRIREAIDRGEPDLRPPYTIGFNTPGRFGDKGVAVVLSGNTENAHICATWEKQDRLDPVYSSFRSWALRWPQATILCDDPGQGPMSHFYSDLCMKTILVTRVSRDRLLHRLCQLINHGCLKITSEFAQALSDAKITLGPDRMVERFDGDDLVFALALAAIALPAKEEGK